MREPFKVRQYDKDLNVLNEYEIDVDSLTSAIFSANIHAMRSFKNVEYFDIIDNSYMVMDDGSVKRWILTSNYKAGNIPENIHALPRYIVSMGNYQYPMAFMKDTSTWGIKEYIELFANMKNNIDSEITAFSEKFKVTGVILDIWCKSEKIKTFKS